MSAQRLWLWTAGLALVAGCAGSGKVPKYVTGFDQIRPGMSKSEVRQLLGMPSLVSTAPGSPTPTATPAPTDEWAAFKQEMNSVFSDGELWQYGEFTFSDLGNAPQLMDGSPKSFAVWFDNHGKVQRMRRPLEGHSAGPAQAPQPPAGSSPDMWSGDPFGRDKAKAGPPTGP